MSRTAVALACAFLACASPSAGEECLPTRSATELGNIFTLSQHRLSRDEPFDRLAHPQAAGAPRYLRAIIEVVGDKNGAWTLDIRDPALHVLQTLGPRDFASNPRRWTDRLPFREIFVDLNTRMKPEELTVRITEYFVIPDKLAPTFYSVQGDIATWAPLYERDDTEKNVLPASLVRLGDSVGMLLVPIEGKMQSCTGFAVTRDLLLTNWHCGPTLVPSGDGLKEIPDLFWSNDMCRRVLIDFSWDDDRISRDFECDAVVERNQELDYALLRIAPVSASSALKPVRLATARPGSDSRVSIIHHPLAEQKRVSRECPLGPNLSRASWRGDIPATEFEHLCDTEGGSSGAPVFDETGAVVGLHHLGFDRDRVTCELLPNIPKVNKAVWIDFIVADLKKKGVTLSLDRPAIANE